MLAFEIHVGLAVLIGVALVLGTRAATFDDEPEDVADNGLPEHRLLRSDDIPRLRFRVGWRGYRMSDVDAALEAARLALEAARLALEAAERPAGTPEPVLSDQPPSAVDRPLSELEETAPDDGR